MSVSFVQPDFAALPETDGHGDTCGPIAMLDYRHIIHGVALDMVTLNDSRNELIEWGLMNQPGLPGMTMHQIELAFTEHYQVYPVKTVLWGQVNGTQLHNDLINALVAHQAVILETSAAHNLPGNQPGVNNHYVLAWGIQSDIGFYVANGDTLLALASGQVPVGPVWYTWGNIQAAQIGAYMVLPGV